MSLIIFGGIAYTLAGFAFFLYDDPDYHSSPLDVFGHVLGWPGILSVDLYYYLKRKGWIR